MLSTVFSFGGDLPPKMLHDQHTIALSTVQINALGPLSSLLWLPLYHYCLYSGPNCVALSSVPDPSFKLPTLEQRTRLNGFTISASFLLDLVTPVLWLYPASRTPSSKVILTFWLWDWIKSRPYSSLKLSSKFTYSKMASPIFHLAISFQYKASYQFLLKHCQMLS